MGKTKSVVSDAAIVLYVHKRLGLNILALFVTNLFEVTQYTITVANIVFTVRSAVNLMVDCETMRVKGAESA